ncbi:MAG: ABC transporter permease [Bacteroidetes bacterium]|jgi:putative ABC transport system permease protein|uniref:ABC transporter permease n=1 Tax=unclassified Phnomibacter TaxID=2836226 RepID=UPI002FDC8AF8|nr:ABC transporter permease [Bacteroidota bacterium]MCC6760137.1 ABC transporter permease [Chitinophagaceae bacterium]
MQIGDSIGLAWQTVKVNKLRTGITVAIIALGIMALIGIITAIEAMNQSLRESFSTMGANGFNIRFRERNFFMGGNNNRSVQKTTKSAQKVRTSNTGRFITYQEAVGFKRSYTYPATVSISLRGSFNETVQYITNEKAYKTNPNVAFQGGDENYLELNGYKMAAGRNFTLNEVETGRAVVVIGDEVLNRCFEGNAKKAIDKIVKIGNRPYLVIGVLEKKGASAFLNLDNVAITSYNNIRQVSSSIGTFSIGVMVSDYKLLDNAVGQATGVFRNIRKLDIQENDNFYIDKSDALAEKFIGFLSGITGSAAVIGLITLIGAAIGLMNIMLVAVTERTKEVGLSKAIGATSQTIRRQFLFESIIISLLGAAIGIVLGVVVGNIFGIILNTGFVIPWGWVFAGVIICFVTGLLAGVYPAGKAAKLDPIVALRYE